ncbi:MAG: class I SAM-dependent methyltransferase [Aeromicrobium sp.]
MRIDGSLAGYSVVIRCDVPDRGKVHWVSQLVVAEQYRNLRFATELLFSAWNFSGAYAWGLATANPYAVRALETTTRRHCSRRLIVERGDELCEALGESIPYAAAGLARDEEGKVLTTIDTVFYLDHTDVQTMKENAGRKDRPWGLGKELPEGHEWFAAVFGDQDPKDMGSSRLEHLLTSSSESWEAAYARMSLNEDHLWMRHTEAETEFLGKYLPAGGRVVDVGCGVGRHSEALKAADSSCEVEAIDFVAGMIDRATSMNPDSHVRYRQGDVREERGKGDADLVLALYDVVGSSTNSGDDERLLDGIASFVRPGGHVVISVMNAAPMLSSPHLVRASDDADLVTALERLPSSGTMESTGDVFDPSLCVERNGIFFRKEAFTAPGAALATELIVRDRRFTLAEIVAMIQNAGLEVERATPVQAGSWTRSQVLDESDARAKEILVVARKPSV